MNAKRVSQCTFEGVYFDFFLTKHFWARDEKVPGDFFFYKKLLFGGSKTALKRVLCIGFRIGLQIGHVMEFDEVWKREGDYVGGPIGEEHHVELQIQSDALHCVEHLDHPFQAWFVSLPVFHTVFVVQDNSAHVAWDMHLLNPCYFTLTGSKL